VLTARKEIARRYGETAIAENIHLTSLIFKEACSPNVLELLSKVHTLGNLADMSFQVVESNYSVGFSFHTVTLFRSINISSSRTLCSNSIARISNGDGKHAPWDTNLCRNTFKALSCRRLLQPTTLHSPQIPWANYRKTISKR
jgi:hypothetical protein